MIQEKDHSILDSETPCWVHCQLIMFHLPSHKTAHGTHNIHVSNPLNNNKVWVKFH